MKAKIDKDGQRIANTTQLYHGSEPKWGVSDKTLYTRIGEAINWYAVVFDNKDFKSWVLKYMKENGMSTDFHKSVIDSDFRSAGMLIRMKEKGCPFTEEWDNRVTKLLKNLRLTDPKVSEVKINRVPTTNKSSNSLAILEALLDDVFLGKVTIKPTDTWYSLNLLTIPDTHMQDLYNRLDSHLTKLEDALDAVEQKSPEDLIEGYSNFKDGKLKSYIDSLQILQDLCDGSIKKLLQQKEKIKATAPVKIKEKKEKIVDLDKLVSFCSFQKSMKDPDIVSILPKKVIGADQIMVYDTEKAIITLYRSKTSDGFSIKGTTLTNVDENLSIRKTVRKPKETLLELLKMNKTQQRKLVSELTTKPKEITGRMNINTVIIKVE